MAVISPLSTSFKKSMTLALPFMVGSLGRGIGPGKFQNFYCTQSKTTDGRMPETTEPLIPETLMPPRTAVDSYC
jgi:hypothetical protein